MVNNGKHSIKFLNIFLIDIINDQGIVQMEEAVEVQSPSNAAKVDKKKQQAA
jgi:hypothetical protein